MKDYQFASSPWGFRMRPISDHCGWLKNHGFRYFCGQFSRELKGAFPTDLSDDGIRQAVKDLQGYGLALASFNADGDFMMAEKVEDQVALCCGMIDRAALFGPKLIIVFAGWQNRDDAAVYAQVSHCLKQVARHAGRYGLTVALENHGGLTGTAEQINTILDKVKEPNIGVNYDPANFLMYGADPYKNLVDLKHPVVFTHFKSVKKTNGKKVYCRLREGEIDYIPILKTLEKTYNGFYAIEYEDPADVFEGSEDDLKILKELLGKI